MTNGRGGGGGNYRNLFDAAVPFCLLPFVVRTLYFFSLDFIVEKVELYKREIKRRKEKEKVERKTEYVQFIIYKYIYVRTT